ncbi:MAG TPA: hypothetical protein VGO80_07185 [Solirubrobacteraceae bacterium]|jgi:hypothetical protein|nr:hypothetical protein [Solirubrobacteraceae bacterium]
MKALSSDAGRFLWCRSQAVWLNLALVARLEDLDGAMAAGQSGLIRYSAVAIGEDCAVILALTTRNEKPLPSRKLRASWALARIRDHELWPQCWQLVRSFDCDASDADIKQACDRLVAATREIVGEVPDGLTNDGYFPMLSLTREWYKLLDAVGEKGFLPEEWTRRASPVTRE